MVTPELYEEYMFWRRQGCRAIAAYLICKMGFLNFVIEYYGDEE